MSQPALQINNLVKDYGKTRAVDGLSLEVQPGEFFGYLGPNGAGKTSTIHAVTGIARFNEGTIRVFGRDVVKEYRDARRLVGLSPQEFNVDIFATPRLILDIVGGYYGMARAKRKERTEMLLERFDLAQHAEKEFRMLSGGLKRRVMLARALIHDPELLILDEPTAGVDVELRRELWVYLRELNEEGKTILLTSHYLEEVELLCNRIAIIGGGKIAMIGDKKDFMKNGKRLEDTYMEIANRSKEGKVK
jgi:ABC-2 type transport system ATP-binding protein